MIDVNSKKFTTLVHHIIHECGPLSEKDIAAILMKIDQTHYAVHGHPLTNATYRKTEGGVEVIVALEDGDEGRIGV
jgi:hypothetical protein